MNHHCFVHQPLPELLARQPLFRNLGSGQLEHLAQRSRERRFRRNETLFHKGDVPHSIFTVVYGQVKLALPAANGNEKVIELVGPEHSFGEVALLSESPYPVFAQAVTDTLLIQVTREGIFELFDAVPAFARDMLSFVARRTYALIQDVECYTQQTCTQRVISFLRQHCENDGCADADSIQIVLPASKQVIASRLNLTPETLSRVFNELSSAELIDVQGKTITIHCMKRLQAFEARN